jgi:hypothetical protein
MQLFTSGPYSCPADQTCNDAIPLVVNGSARDALNLQMFKGSSPTDPITGLGTHAFVRTLVSRIVGGLFFEPFAEQNQRKLNIYYRSVQFNEGGGVADVDATGIMTGFVNGSATGTTFRFGRDSIASFRHESGHALFGLTDEYSCVDDNHTVRVQPDRFPNLFASFATCTQLSTSRSSCRILGGAPSACTPPREWSKADPDADIMGSGNNVDTSAFGPDCRSRIDSVFRGFP